MYTVFILMVFIIYVLQLLLINYQNVKDESINALKKIINSYISLLFKLNSIFITFKFVFNGVDL